MHESGWPPAEKVTELAQPEPGLERKWAGAGSGISEAATVKTSKPMDRVRTPPLHHLSFRLFGSGRRSRPACCLFDGTATPAYPSWGCH